MMIGGLLMAFITSPKLSLLFLGLMPLIVLGLAVVFKKARPLFAKVQEHIDAINQIAQENLSGVRLVKSFLRADREIDRFGKANDRLSAQALAAARLTALAMPFMLLVFNMGLVSVIWYGGGYITAGDMTVGELIAFINYMIMTLLALVVGSLVLPIIARAEASAERILKVMETKPDIQDKPDAVSNFIAAGPIAFENAAFSYNQTAEDPVLHDLSFTAESGQTIAILGATGAAKTTLVNLIPRFYDVDAGRVTIDGRDVRDLDQTALRQQIGMVLQESILFSGSIRENIRLWDGQTPQQQKLKRPPKPHRRTTLSRNFPTATTSQLGQRGVNLSGGPKTAHCHCPGTHHPPQSTHPRRQHECR